MDSSFPGVNHSRPFIVNMVCLGTFYRFHDQLLTLKIRQVEAVTVPISASSMGCANTLRTPISEPPSLRFPRLAYVSSARAVLGRCFDHQH
jgi:hypothetical protein